MDSEFDAGSMRITGQRVTVHYEIDGMRATVYPEGPGVGLNVLVIDRDNLSIDMGIAEFKLTRAN